MYDGHLTRMDGDDAYVGRVASLSFDIDITVMPNAFKTNDKHPDYHVEGRSPRGRPVRIGSAWEERSMAGNQYLSLVINIPGQPVIRCNAVRDTDPEKQDLRIIPFTEMQAA